MRSPAADPFRVRWIRRMMIGVAGTLGMCGPSWAGVDFIFNFTDAAGVGFNANGQTGADRRGGLYQAAGYISSVFSGYNATIHIDVNGAVTDDNALASAGYYQNTSYPGTGFESRGDVMMKILGNPDPSAGPDGIINWNFEDFMWEPLDDFQSGELDMISTATHELAHVLGFMAGVTSAGQDYWGTPLGTSSTWSPYDQWLADANGQLINGAYQMDIARWNDASTAGSGANGLLFVGANAMAANGGEAVRLYSPLSWLDGSSASHLDTDFYTGDDVKLMNHTNSVFEGRDLRTFSDIEIGMLRDMGYTLAIPEPGIPLLGFGGALLVLGVRRRTLLNG